jgi:hypothetical protein
MKIVISQIARTLHLFEIVDFCNHCIVPLLYVSFSLSIAKVPFIENIISCDENA